MAFPNRPGKAHRHGGGRLTVALEQEGGVAFDRATHQVEIGGHRGEANAHLAQRLIRRAQQIEHGRRVRRAGDANGLGHQRPPATAKSRAGSPA
jgi:hypothetical protein